MTDPALINYTPNPARPPRAPVVVNAVTLETTDGRTLRFPVDKPVVLERPPRRVDLLGGKAFVSCD